MMTLKSFTLNDSESYCPTINGIFTVSSERDPKKKNQTRQFYGIQALVPQKIRNTDKNKTGAN